MAEAARNLDPESTPTPEPQAATVADTPSTVTSSGRPIAPIRRGWRKMRGKADELGKNSVGKASTTKEWLYDNLRYEVDKDAEQKNILLPPEAFVYAAGDVLDGTVLNAIRRTNDVLDPAGSFIRSAYRTFTRPVFHPIDTLTKPAQYLSNPIRGATSGVRLAKNIAMAPLRGTKDYGDRAIRRATQRFGKIPLIGPITSGVAKATSWVLEKPAQAGEWATSWADEVDAKIEEFQNTQ